MSIASVIKTDAKNRALRTGVQVVGASGVIAGLKAVYDGFIGGTIDLQSVETAAAIGALTPLLAYIHRWKFSPASVPQVPAFVSVPIATEAQNEVEKAITMAETDPETAEASGPEVNTEPALDLAQRVAVEIVRIQQSQQVPMPPPTDGTGTPTPAS